MISGADKEITIFSKEGKLFQIGKDKNRYLYF